MHRHLLAVVYALVALSLAGCAGVSRPLPADIVTPPPGNLQLVEVLGNIAAHTGAHVRWGGTVVEVTRQASGFVRIQVLERKLDASGQPLNYGPSDGRFVIRAASNVDPARYRIGSEVTVAGTIEGAVTVGGTSLPLVHVDHYVRWEPPPVYPPDYYDPWWYGYPYYDYDPWYPGPWYPYHMRYGVGLGLR